MEGGENHDLIRVRFRFIPPAFPSFFPVFLLSLFPSFPQAEHHSGRRQDRGAGPRAGGRGGKSSGSAGRRRRKVRGNVGDATEASRHQGRRGRGGGGGEAVETQGSV